MSDLHPDKVPSTPFEHDVHARLVQVESSIAALSSSLKDFLRQQQEVLDRLTRIEGWMRANHDANSKRLTDAEDDVRDHEARIRELEQQKAKTGSTVSALERGFWAMLAAFTGLAVTYIQSGPLGS